MSPVLLIALAFWSVGLFLAGCWVQKRVDRKALRVYEHYKRRHGHRGHA